MTRLGRLLGDRSEGRARRPARAAPWATAGGRALAVALAGGLLLVPLLGKAAPGERTAVRPAAPRAAAAPVAWPVHLSAHAVAARQRALAAAGAAHSPVVPPSLRHTRQPVGQVWRP
jgi:hypothetical protein